MSGQVSNLNFTFYHPVFKLKHPAIYSLIKISWFTFFNGVSLNFLKGLT